MMRSIGAGRQGETFSALKNGTLRNEMAGDRANYNPRLVVVIWRWIHF